MMLMCEHCNERFDEDDLDYREEPAEYDNGISGVWKTPCCPYCGSDCVYKYREE